jgi:hypothetical protein
MDQNVANQLRGQKEKVLIQTDGPLAGTAAPSALLVENPGLREAQSQLLRHTVEPGNKVKPTLAAEPEPEKLDAGLNFAAVSQEFQSMVPGLRQPHRSVAGLSEPYREIQIHCAKVYHIRE